MTTRTGSSTSAFEGEAIRSPVSRACRGSGCLQSPSLGPQPAKCPYGRPSVLGSESVTNVLHALATGHTDRAVNVVAMSDELDEEARSVLWGALIEDQDPPAQARRFGDGLRSLGAPRHLVNECYRVSFYSGDEWKRLSGNPLFGFFTANRAGRPLDKWVHYFPIYDRHLE